MMNHTWAIHKLFANRDYPTKTVSKVELRCTSTDPDSGEVVERLYAVDIPLGDSPFIPFQQLTKDVVLGWCGDLSVFEAQNADALSAKLLEPVEYAFPWV